MAIPTFSFGSYASDLVNPNRVLVPTTLTAADRPVAERYKTETEAYNQAMDKYRQDVEAYNAALETWNAGPRDKEFTMTAPTAPADLGYTTEDVQAFEAAAASRAAAQQAAKQNALNIIMNPEGFSQQYGIGSLSFADGGDVPQTFAGTGEFPETDPSQGYTTRSVSTEANLPLFAELMVDSIPVVGDIKAGIEGADYLKRGEYGNSLLSFAGVMPLVPPLAGILKQGAPVSKSSLDDLTSPELITSWVVAPEKVNRNEFITKLSSRPEVLEKSQKALNDLGYGETVPMFRIVKLTDNKELLPESLISATLNPKNVQQNFEFLSTGKFGFNPTDYRLLRYDVPREKITGYLPALVEEITPQVNKKVKQKGFGQDKVKGMNVVDNPSEHAKRLITLQDEILADVSGIKPQVLMSPQGKPQNLLSIDASNVTFPVASGKISKVEDLPESFYFKTPKERGMYEDAIKVYQNFFSKNFQHGGAVHEGIGSLPFEEDLYRMESNPRLGFGAYGIRHSGEGLKGKGYFGEISSPNGQVVTEYSVYDEDIGEYPSIVPTLTREEITDTISRSTKGEQPSIEVIRKARRHAIERLSEGKSPFSSNTELRFPLPSGASEDLINRISRYLENKRPND